MNDIKEYKGLVYKIIGAAMDVHAELGYGLLEPIYQEALAMELEDRGISYETEKTVNVFYKGKKLNKEYRMDMVVDDIIVELKAVREIIPEHRAQLCNYLRLTQKPIGILINFGDESLYGERWWYNKEDNLCYKLDKNMQTLNVS